MSQKNNDSSKEVRVLSLNGGGVKGLFTIAFLAELERIICEKEGRSDVNIGDHFDLITGTSIGGILALGFASGKSAREMEKVFRDSAAKIFPPNKIPFLSAGFKFIKRLVAPVYRSEPLRETVLSLIDEATRFNDLKRRVMIPSISLSTGKPFFFKTPHNPNFNRDGKLKLVDAAMATSAAPTYFAPHYCEDLETYYADGGLVANNPSYVGMKEVLLDMQSDFPKATIEDIKILNVGTLGEEYAIAPINFLSKVRRGYFGIWGGGEKLVLTTMTANQRLHKDMLFRDLNAAGAKDNYVYMDDTVPSDAANSITLDNASESSLQYLVSRGKQLASTQYTGNAQLRRFFERPAVPFTPSITTTTDKV